MAISFKQKCSRCKKNYVVATRRSRWVECYDCERPKLMQKVEDPEMAKMFDIPEEFYKENSFLRSIKINYHRFGSLTERQLEAFKKTVEDMKAEIGAPKEKIDPSKIEITDRLY